MTHVLVLLLALLIGVVAGLRALTAPAVVAWAAFLGWIDLHGTWASWVANIDHRRRVHRARRRRTGHRPAAEDADPHGAAAVRRPAHHRRVRRRGDRRVAALDLHRARGRHHRCGARHPRWLPGAQALVAANGGRDLPSRCSRMRSRSGRVRHRGGDGSRADQYLLTAVSDPAFRRDHRRRRPGRPAAGRSADAAGQRVAVVERKLIGGTCVNTGCIPTKTLVASAHAAHLARRGADYGVGDRTGQRRHGQGQGAQGRHHARRPQRRRGLARGHGRLHRASRARPLRGSAHHCASTTTCCTPTGSSSTSVAARWCRTSRAWPMSTT